MAPGQSLQPRAIRRDRVPRRVRGRLPPRRAALLARAGAVGLRRPHLDHRRRGFLRRSPPPRAARATATTWCSSRTTGNWLFALESAASLPERARMTVDGQLFASTPVRARMRYEMTSVIDAAARRATRTRGSCAARCACRRTPTRGRTALGARVARRREDRRRGPRAGHRLPARGPLRLHARAAAARRATRWTSSCSARKEGFCEHFASAFVFLMRAAGRAGARGDRLPGRRAQPVRQHHYRAPVRRARLGRGVPRARAAGCASIRPPPRCPAGWKPVLRARCRGPSSCR